MHQPAQQLGTEGNLVLRRAVPTGPRLPAYGAARHSDFAYWTMLTSVPNISSAVVIVRELAW
jgi:hypothetical protein